jgi:curved DNA-binding protein CbpA
MRALDVLELEADADFATIKRAWREKAKTVHPDVKPGDKEAAAEFQKLQVAYEVLKAGEARREWHG